MDRTVPDPLVPHRPGYPESWPANPFGVHDLAITACTRIEAAASANPFCLQQWHAFNLPCLLKRLRVRLGDGC